MQKSILDKWCRTTRVLLIEGVLAWTTKLGVILSTNGQVSDTAAFDFFMNMVLSMLIVGSTAIGSRLKCNRHLSLRAITIILSPIIIFASLFLFGMITNLFFQSSAIWFAQQEALIAMVVLVYISFNYNLNHSLATVSDQFSLTNIL